MLLDARCQARERQEHVRGVDAEEDPLKTGGMLQRSNHAFEHRLSLDVEEGAMGSPGSGCQRVFTPTPPGQDHGSVSAL